MVISSSPKRLPAFGMCTHEQFLSRLSDFGISTGLTKKVVLMFDKLQGDRYMPPLSRYEPDACSVDSVQQIAYPKGVEWRCSFLIRDRIFRFIFLVNDDDAFDSFSGKWIDPDIRVLKVFTDDMVPIFDAEFLYPKKAGVKNRTDIINVNTPELDARDKEVIKSRPERIQSVLNAMEHIRTNLDDFSHLDSMMKVYMEYNKRNPLQSAAFVDLQYFQFITQDGRSKMLGGKVKLVPNGIGKSFECSCWSTVESKWCDHYAEYITEHRDFPIIESTSLSSESEFTVGYRFFAGWTVVPATIRVFRSEEQEPNTVPPISISWQDDCEVWLDEYISGIDLLKQIESHISTGAAFDLWMHWTSVMYNNTSSPCFNSSNTHRNTKMEDVLVSTIEGCNDEGKKIFALANRFSMLEYGMCVACKRYEELKIEKSRFGTEEKKKKAIKTDVDELDMLFEYQVPSYTTQGGYASRAHKQAKRFSHILPEDF